MSTTAVALNTASTSGQKLIVKNTDATNGADLGSSSVTAGTGFALAAGQTVTVEVQPRDVLFAIRSAAADVVLAVARVGG
ncbi:MAG TPA: hypothetical protein VGQ29_08490 [Gemmatimonadales bacterium]|nr:hypothetical protein [Gemmatimonadales bacterium]